MIIRRNPQVESSPLKDELLLFHGSANKFFVMNSSAAFLWQELRVPAAAEDLAARMCSSFTGVDADRALSDVRGTLRQMVELGLLIEDGNGPNAAGDS